MTTANSETLYVKETLSELPIDENVGMITRRGHNKRATLGKFRNYNEGQDGIKVWVGPYRDKRKDKMKLVINYYFKNGKIKTAHNLKKTQTKMKWPYTCFFFNYREDGLLPFDIYQDYETFSDTILAVNHEERKDLKFFLKRSKMLLE